MTSIRIVLVGIEGAYNLGVIARTCVNFGVNELYLVNPVASIEEAYKYAARGRELLSKSVVVSSLEEALKNVDVSVATSAIGYSEGDALRQAVSIDYLVENVIPGASRVALIFGRESTGLTREELSKADFLVSIPANPEYPVLNISQSVAIFLWEIWKRTGTKPTNIPPRATRERLDAIMGVITEITSRVVSSSDKAERCNRVLRNLIYRSMPSEFEARVLFYWTRRVLRKITESTQSNSTQVE